jgi:hypothetical protein
MPDDLGLSPVDQLASVDPLDPGSCRRKLSLSQEVLVGVVKVIDFCLVLTAGAAAFALYVAVALHSTEEAERYILTSLLGATLFVAGFQYIRGYTLRQLSMLHWQLTRATLMWAIVVSVLLLVAFTGKVSETYSRGWTLSWAVSALVFIMMERLFSGSRSLTGYDKATSPGTS